MSMLQDLLIQTITHCDSTTICRSILQNHSQHFSHMLFTDLMDTSRMTWTTPLLPPPLPHFPQPPPPQYPEGRQLNCTVHKL